MMAKAAYHPQLSVLLHERRGTRLVFLISSISGVTSVLPALVAFRFWGLWDTAISGLV